MRSYTDKHGDRCLKVCNAETDNMMHFLVHCMNPESKEVIFLDQPRSGRPINFEFIEMVKGKSRNMSKTRFRIYQLNAIFE